MWQVRGSECLGALNHWQDELASRLKVPCLKHMRNTFASEIPLKQAVDEARFQIADAVLTIQKLVAGAVDKVEATDSAAWT